MPKTARKPRAKPGDVPRGHAHRVGMARHRPENFTLLVADVAVLFGVSPSAIRCRDGELRPARLGRGRECRRYSWEIVDAYRKTVTAPKETA